MPALLAHDGTTTIHCRICGDPIPLPFVATSADEQPDPSCVLMTFTVDGAALRAHLLLTHGMTDEES